MLKYIKEMLPYPYCYLGAAGTIYSIAEDRELRKHVKYNAEKKSKSNFIISISYFCW